MQQTLQVLMIHLLIKRIRIIFVICIISNSQHIQAQPTTSSENSKSTVSEDVAKEFGIDIDGAKVLLGEARFFFKDIADNFQFISEKNNIHKKYRKADSLAKNCFYPNSKVVTSNLNSKSKQYSNKIVGVRQYLERLAVYSNRRDVKIELSLNTSKYKISDLEAFIDRDGVKKLQMVAGVWQTFKRSVKDPEGKWKKAYEDATLKLFSIIVTPTDDENQPYTFKITEVKVEQTIPLEDFEELIASPDPFNNLIKKD